MKEELPFATMSQDIEDKPGLIEQPGVNVMVRGPAGDSDDDPTASPVVQAHRFAQGAEEAARRAEFAAASDLHLKAAKAFLKAVEQVRDHGVLASALLLLADSHAARAEEATVRRRISKKGKLPSSSRRDRVPAVALMERGGLLMESDRTPRALSAVADMADSIMRGPAASSNTQTRPSTTTSASTVAAEELVKKFRPQRDDLLELERQLAKLGLESKVGGAGAGGRARHRAGASPGVHLSSALGESFCLLNQSVILGGGVGIGGGGVIGGGGGYGGNAPVPTSQQQQQQAVVMVSERAGSRVSTAAGGGENGRVGRISRGGGRERRDGAPDEDEVSEAARLIKSSTGPGSRVVDRGVAVGRGEDQSATGIAGDHEARRFSALEEGKKEARRKTEENYHEEVVRLLTCLKTLGDENVSLMKECEDRERVRQESEAIREEMRRFQVKYQERFTLLKKTLDEVVRSYPLLAGTGVAAGPAAATGGVEGARAAEEIQRLAQANRKLTAQVKKYERYYVELCQKADSKRKEQLAQAKAARQQQLAHGVPAFGQQQQASQSQSQSQQPQQQHIKWRKSTDPGLRRPQGQRDFQGAVGTPMQPTHPPVLAPAGAQFASQHGHQHHQHPQQQQQQQHRQSVSSLQHPQGSLVACRSLSAPVTRQQQPQRKQPGAAVGGASQTAFVQQQQQQQQLQLRQNQPKPQQRRNQQQHQLLGQSGSSSGGILGNYRGTGSSQGSVAAVVHGASGRGVATSLVASVGQGGGVVYRSAGLADESEV